MKLYYKGEDTQDFYIDDKLDKNKLKYIADFKSIDEIYKFIKEYWELRGVPVYYFNVHNEGDYFRIDYGSHTQFYYACPNDENEFLKSKVDTFRRSRK